MILANHISLVAWTTTILLAFILSFVLGRALSMRTGVVLILSLAGVVITGAFLLIFSAISQPQPCKVMITSPKNETEIRGYQINVSGNVDPPPARVTVIVRSETDKKWWVQDIIRPKKPSGSWSMNAQIGEENVGADETYEIVALASNDSRVFNIFTGRYLYKGLTLNQTPGWNQSELVIIRRTY